MHFEEHDKVGYVCVCLPFEKMYNPTCRYGILPYLINWACECLLAWLDACLFADSITLNSDVGRAFVSFTRTSCTQWWHSSSRSSSSPSSVCYWFVSTAHRDAVAPLWWLRGAAIATKVRRRRSCQRVRMTSTAWRVSSLSWWSSSLSATYQRRCSTTRTGRARSAELWRTSHVVCRSCSRWPTPPPTSSSTALWGINSAMVFDARWAHCGAAGRRQMAVGVEAVFSGRRGPRRQSTWNSETSTLTRWGKCRTEIWTYRASCWSETPLSTKPYLRTSRLHWSIFAALDHARFQNSSEDVTFCVVCWCVGFLISSVLLITDVSDAIVSLKWRLIEKIPDTYQRYQSFNWRKN